MKRLTITLRVSMLCTLLATAVAVTALIIMMANEARLLRDYYRDSLMLTAQLAQDEISYRQDGRLDIDRHLDDLPNVRVAIYSRYGDLLYGHERFSKPFETDIVTQSQGTDGTMWYVYDTLLTFENDAQYYLRCYMPASAADSVHTDRSHMLWLLLPVLVLLAAWGGYGIARRAFLPVAQIVTLARGISNGSDLKKRIGLQGADDEISHMASAFDEMLERLEHAFEREQQFTSDVSHELRTPITGILTESSFALSELADEADRIEALKEIDQRARYMSELIQRLLLLARMDAHQLNVHMERLNLSDLAQTAYNITCEQAETRNMQVELDTEKDIWVKADEMLLLQAVLNLTGNAVRYGNTGGIIRIRTEQVHGQAILFVEDNGPGIPPEALNHLFERFYQADPSHHGGGAGLGLALVESIVRLHGGYVDVETQLGLGSRFQIRLPLEEEAS